MNRAEAAKLLAYCAANDQRTVGEVDVLTWYDQLAPIDFDRALEAARQHYRRQPDARLKPGHIWGMCRTITEAEAADRDLATPCDQGTYHRPCGAVHHAHEACASLRQVSIRTALANAFRSIDA